jgi:hypothetical protein
VTQPVITRDATLADDWPAPRSSRVPRWVRFSLPVALLAIVGALVYAGHGFDPYRSRISYRTPGQTVLVGGVLELTPYEAVATRDDSVWKVVVYGTCRNTSDSDLLDYQLAQRALRTFDPVSRTFGQSTSRSLWFGGTGQVFRSTINPGLATQYCRLSDELPATLTLPGHLGVAAFEVSQQDQTSSKIGDTAWVVSGTQVWLYLVPLTIGA